MSEPGCSPFALPKKETGMIKVRQEQIGDYEMGGALFTLLNTTDEGDECNLNNFVLTYIDSDDDAMGVVVNAAFAEDYLG